MKRILGLDLGSASIGWAMISTNGENTTILGLGSRIIPYEGTEGKDFEKGTGESRNAKRTANRTGRKGYDRYQLRRTALVQELIKSGMAPSEEIKAYSKTELWSLRNRAVSEKISLQELGRLLLWLNQKRGYKSSRSDANLNKKDTEYVSQVKSRHQTIKDAGITIGQFFYQNLQKNDQYRVKENIFPREAYIDEFDAICVEQQKYHPELNNDLICKIKKEIIYYQRQLKSQKGLVSVCEFESKEYTNKKGVKQLFGPKVAPKSSPVFQLDKIWQTINNLKLNDTKGEDIIISEEEKNAIFSFLDNNEVLKKSSLQKILGRDNIVENKQLKSGIKGNITKCTILKCFAEKKSKYLHLFDFKFTIETDVNQKRYNYDKKTGEILGEKPKMWISDSIEKSMYNMLWHTIYAIKDQEECKTVLMRKFKIEEAIAQKLSALDFTVSGFGNKSTKVIRNILPYLMQGDRYDVAMSYGGYDHSNSITKEGNASRLLLDKLELIPKNSLRQPIVERILNQSINVVNAIIDKYGKPDEIRIELARELKQSKEERNNTDSFMRNREKINVQIALPMIAEYNQRATRKNIIKWRLFQEIAEDSNKQNAMCIYCGQPISLSQTLNGTEVEVEHIIPKAKLFDDSQSNKTLAHSKCNSDKRDITAFDFMAGKSGSELESYIKRVNNLYEKKLIGKSKRDKFLMSEKKIPQDFIDRQLRESQYVARKAREIMQTICKDVWATSGEVTAKLRRLWGWDDITMDLQFEKYKKLGLTNIVEWVSEHGKNSHKKEVITDFSKRNDHRHHAIDALVIACTKQGYIQRLNTLSSESTSKDLEQDLQGRKVKSNIKLSQLEKYIISEKPLTTSQVAKAVDDILISFKSGKKVTTPGTRKIGKRGNKSVAQTGIIVPRGALHEESVYGRIKLLDKNKPLKYIFQNPDLILKSYIKDLVVRRLKEHGNDVNKAIKSVTKDPIYLDKAQTIKLEYATCFKHEYVIKYTVDINFNKTDKVIDSAIRGILQQRLAKFSGKEKEAFREVKMENGESVAWYVDEGLKRPIHSVRCLTGLSAVVSVKSDENGMEVGFVKPGNNHHVAIYRDRDGVLQEHVVSFWNAVERKKNGLPVIIKNPMKASEIIEEKDLSEIFIASLPDPSWTFVESMQQNEMFILGMEQELYEEAIRDGNMSLISKCLYRVQKTSSKDYVFRFHLETTTDDVINGKKNDALSQSIGKFIRIHSFGAWAKLNPHKVRINLLGQIEEHD